MAYRDLRGQSKFSYGAIMQNFEALLDGSYTFTSGVFTSLTVSPNNTLVTDSTNGRVGVGTRRPDKVLSIEDAGARVALRVQRNDGDLAYTDYGFTTIETSSDNDFYINNVSAGNILLATGGGNVGIGTIVPLYRLDIIDASESHLRLRQSGVGVNLEFYADGTDGTIGTQSNHRLNFITNNNDRVTIDSVGNVGIGTSDPEELLHLLTDTPRIRFERTDSNDDFNLFCSAAGLGVYNVTDARIDFLINGIGNVGIGLTPTANMAGLSIEAGLLTLKETSTPTADTDYGKIYTKNDNKLYFQDGAGTEHEIAFV